MRVLSSPLRTVVLMIGGMAESHNWELDHTLESLSSVHISDLKTSCRYYQNARLDPEYPLPAPIP